jgi:hypothetical protein
VGGVPRVCRNYAPYSGNGVSGHNYVVGGGGNANFSVEIAKGLRLVLDGFADSGAGAYGGVPSRPFQQLERAGRGCRFYILV